jgi:hypothetical protein
MRDFYLMMINIRAEGEIDSGGCNHLYDVFGPCPPAAMADMVRSFELLGDEQWTCLAAESLQLYSHIHPNADTAREILGIAPVARAAESDILDRYHALVPSLEKLRADYIRKNIDRFSETVIQVR